MENHRRAVTGRLQVALDAVAFVYGGKESRSGIFNPAPAAVV